MVSMTVEERNGNVLKGESKENPPQKISGRFKQLFSALTLIARQSGWLVLVGLVVTTGLFLLFAWLTDEVFSNEFASLDKSVLLGVHNLASPGLDFFFVTVTTIGGTAGVIAVTALIGGLLIWRRHYYYAILSVVAVGGGSLLYIGLKQIFQRIRPDLFSGPLATPKSYSYPSGHSTMAVCVYGLLAFLSLIFVNNRLAQVLIFIFCGLMILLIGLSRVYLGAHYPTDVLAGYFTGGCWLAVIVFSQQVVWRSFFKKDKVN